MAPDFIIFLQCEVQDIRSDTDMWKDLGLWEIFNLKKTKYVQMSYLH